MERGACSARDPSWKRSGPGAGPPGNLSLLNAIFAKRFRHGKGRWNAVAGWHVSIPYRLTTSIAFSNSSSRPAATPWMVRATGTVGWMPTP